jgi:hypothetical protein
MSDECVSSRFFVWAFGRGVFGLVSRGQNAEGTHRPDGPNTALTRPTEKARRQRAHTRDPSFTETTGKFKDPWG